jgi:hypothetical protein
VGLGVGVFPHSHAPPARSRADNASTLISPVAMYYPYGMHTVHPASTIRKSTYLQYIVLLKLCGTYELVAMDKILAAAAETAARHAVLLQKVKEKPSLISLQITRNHSVKQFSGGKVRL